VKQFRKRLGLAPWHRPGLPNLFSVAGHFHMRKFIVGHKPFFVM